MPKHAGGRPEKVINWTQFEDLCNLQCSQGEICSFMKVDPDTLIKHIKKHYDLSYSDAYKRYSENGKTGLRRNQYKLSKKSATMCIWLGKQWLGQSDTIDVGISPESIKEFGTLMDMFAKEQESRKDNK